jgi:hypothetical protein
MMVVFEAQKSGDRPREAETQHSADVANTKGAN